MIAAMIIPTGIGCAIGGHSGDATPAAKLLAAVVDSLIVHPNVVNAAELNEMPANALYVEGSTLDRFMRGEIHLQPGRVNRVLIVCETIGPEVVNAKEAAFYSAGIECQIEQLSRPLKMRGWIVDHLARGMAQNIGSLIDQVGNRDDFDALAIYTPIEVEYAKEYALHGGTNPYGWVEASVSRKVAQAIDKPVAHAPPPNIEEVFPVYSRLGAEGISVANLFCVLKGLSRAPRLGATGLSVDDIGCLVSPAMCEGPVHESCRRHAIPIIVVDENTTHCKSPIVGIHVANYLEAAGVLASMRAGIAPRSVLA
ncbi:MAG: DUF3326 domain-containing protein [Planctomycetota bacterium]|jgi:hypothetical protein